MYAPLRLQKICERGLKLISRNIRDRKRTNNMLLEVDKATYSQWKPENGKDCQCRYHDASGR
jgi:hypothetical protein